MITAPSSAFSVVAGNLLLTMQDVSAFIEKHEGSMTCEHSEYMLTVLGYLSSQMDKIVYVEEISPSERTPKQTLVLNGLHENANNMICEVKATLESFALVPYTASSKEASNE